MGGADVSLLHKSCYKISTNCRWNICKAQCKQSNARVNASEYE